MRAYWFALLALVGLLPLSSTLAAEAPSAEAFGKIPQVSDVVLSPDGKLLAWCDRSRDRPHVVVYEVDARKYRGDTALAEGLKLRSLVWSDNETVLANVSQYQDFGQARKAYHYEVFRTVAIDVVNNTNKMLLMADGVRPLVLGARTLSLRTPKPRTVIMSTIDYSPTQKRRELGTRLAGGRGDEGWVSKVFEVDTRSGKGTPIAEGTPFTRDWVVAADGSVVARSEWKADSDTFTILARDGAGWREILREQHGGQRELYGLMSDGRTLLVSGTNSAGRAIVVGLPLAGGEMKSVLDDPERDVERVGLDLLTQTPESLALGGAKPELRWLDPEAARRFDAVAKSFPGQRVSISGRSENYQRIVAQVETPSTPSVYYLVDFSTRKADIVGEEYPALTGLKLGEVRPITYKARDGKEIPAYLTLPPSGGEKNLPLVVLPHGGPDYRDNYTFDWLAQFMASRGYAVLQPQFRGSSGFGEAWREAGFRQWGLLMQDDVTDGVKALIEQGVADATRVCIVGASYGGYAALAGATFTPELYRCAASIGGVSDLPEILGYVQQHYGEESDTLAYFQQSIGSAFDPQVVARSPARSAAQVKAPILLIHATNDTVVPSTQSELMAKALRKENKTVELVKLPGEDHWLSQTATRVQVLEELDKFLAANLRATP
ncbi:MAG TPA: S9 family peptidase [Steroidobacteraceae bacterium]|jgi:dipeptidyl aminopeptidase/acylaminoacyl peptidase